MTHPTRREVLRWSTAAAATAALGGVGRAADPPPKRVLFFTKSAGYEHDVIARRGPGLAYAERILVGLGQQHGLEVTATKDGRLFTPGQLRAFDVLAFYTTGDLTRPGTDGQPPMPAGGKGAVLDFVAGGGGFVGVHSATDTFHGRGGAVDPYLQMVGGEFVAHGKQQVATQRVEDARFPGAPTGPFDTTEEWYTFAHPAADLHPILTQQTAGMDGAMYRRPAYPSTWARRHGRGRVFYTSMGHRSQTWTDDTFVTLLLGGLAWAAGVTTYAGVAGAGR